MLDLLLNPVARFMKNHVNSLDRIEFPFVVVIPTGDGLNRVAEAVRSLRGRVSFWVITGNEGGGQRAREIRDYLHTRGVDLSKVFIEDRSPATRYHPKEIARDQANGVIPSFRRCVVVSNRFHLPRVCMAFEMQGFDPTPWACDEWPAYRNLIWKAWVQMWRDWWLIRRGLR